MLKNLSIRFSPRAPQTKGHLKRQGCHFTVTKGTKGVKGSKGEKGTNERKGTTS